MPKEKTIDTMTRSPKIRAVWSVAIVHNGEMNFAIHIINLQWEKKMSDPNGFA